MNAKTQTTRQLKQQYEAMFGIQGSRIDQIRHDELLSAVRNQRPHRLCPARGSAARKVQVTPADMARLMGSK